MTTKKPIKIGLLAGFIASLCCLGPLILIVLGIGGVSTALAIGQKSPYFLALGILILGGGLGFYYWRQHQEACQKCEIVRFNWQKMLALIILACAIFFIVYYLLLYVVVPWLAPLVYKNFYSY